MSRCSTRRCLIGTDKLNPLVFRSARNIEGVKVLPAAEFNCYTVLKQKRLVLTKSVLKCWKTVGKKRQET